MLFNGKKFEMLRYGSNEELKNNTNYMTPNQEDLIQVKETLRDPGIMMSNKASLRSISPMYVPR